jgi:hypothetical protein
MLKKKLNWTMEKIFSPLLAHHLDLKPKKLADLVSCLAINNSDLYYSYSTGHSKDPHTLQAEHSSLSFIFSLLPPNHPL